MNDAKSLWGFELFAGLMWILLGSAALFLPVITTLSIVLIFGWILIIAGIFQCVFVLFDWSETGATQFLLGILSLIFGSVLVMNIYSGAVAVTSLIGMFFMMQGFLMILAGFITARTNWALIVSGSISLVAALLIFGNLLTTSLFLVGLLLGIQMIVFGFALVADSTFKSPDAGNVRKTLGVLLVVVIGILLIVNIFKRPEERAENLEAAVDAAIEASVIVDGEEVDTVEVEVN